MHIEIGAVVTCHGGWIGRAEGIIVDQGSLKITSIVIGGAGLGDRPALLPLESVAETSSTGIRLLWSTTDIREAPRMSGVILPLGITAVLLGRHTKVLTAARKSRLLAVGIEDSSGMLQRVVIESGWLFKSAVSMPFGSFTIWPNGDLVVSQGALGEGAAARAGYSDIELETDLANTLRNHDLFKGANRFSIKALVSNGQVELFGNVRFRDDKCVAEQFVRAASARRRVKDYIVSDQELEVRIAELLSRDPQASHCRFHVASYMGHVTVEVPEAVDERLRLAIRKVVQSEPGVVALDITVMPTHSPWEYTVVPKKVYTSAVSEAAANGSSDEGA